jgi:hypothetical protein
LFPGRTLWLTNSSISPVLMAFNETFNRLTPEKGYHIHLHK